MSRLRARFRSPTRRVTWPEARSAVRPGPGAGVIPGLVALRVERRYALADIADAHRRAAEGHTVGKLVVTP
ncbi:MULTISPECIES: zinc-binding dehydrogenase [unclassified Arthrobacter]|uniref:zinc-binding dehydrogenase n=1 Tax=Arthrobacter sp. N1 TaxID=619291 RepID=UPI003BB10744